MEKELIFKGSGVALVTPMTKDGDVDYAMLSNLVSWHVRKGTDALIICGTTAENPTLSSYEWEKTIQTAIDTCEGAIPIIAGTGSNNTAHAVELTKRAEALGADGALVVTPYYNKTSQHGLIRHFVTVAQCSNLPIILYNVPSRTGLNIKPETYLQLAEHPNIVAIKEANSNISEIAQTLSLCGDKLAMYSGNDDQIVPIMSMGGMGVISVWGNIMPTECALLCDFALKGDFKAATDLQLKYLPLINSLFADVNPIPVKEAMNLMSIPVGPCRGPLYEITPTALKELKGQLERFKLLNKGLNLA